MKYQSKKFILMMLITIISCSNPNENHKRIFEKLEQRLTKEDKYSMDTCTNTESFLRFIRFGALEKYTNFFDSIHDELSIEIDSLKINKYWPVCYSYAYLEYKHNKPYDLSSIYANVTGLLDSQVKWISNAVNLPIRVQDSNIVLLSLHDTIKVNFPDTSYKKKTFFFAWKKSNWQSETLNFKEDMELQIIKKRYDDNNFLYKARILNVDSNNYSPYRNYFKIGHVIFLDIENYNNYFETRDRNNTP